MQTKQQAQQPTQKTMALQSMKVVKLEEWEMSTVSGGLHGGYTTA